MKLPKLTMDRGNLMILWDTTVTLVRVCRSKDGRFAWNRELLPWFGTRTREYTRTYKHPGKTIHRLCAERKFWMPYVFVIHSRNVKETHEYHTVEGYTNAVLARKKRESQHPYDKRDGEKI